MRWNLGPLRVRHRGGWVASRGGGLWWGKPSGVGGHLEDGIQAGVKELSWVLGASAVSGMGGESHVSYLLGS